MPELPGPPEDWPDAERQAWLQGAATVASLMADQWAIIADQYEQAAADPDGHAGPATTASDGQDGDETADDDEDDDQPDPCPDCGSERLDGLGGPVCPNCDL